MTIISGAVYYHAENEKSSLMLDAYHNQMQGIGKRYFSDVKELYLNLINGEKYQALIHASDPYRTDMPLVMEVQQLLSEGQVNGYIKGCNLLNLSEGWVLGEYGLYEIDSIHNKDELYKFVEDIDKTANTVNWVDSGYESPFEQSFQYGYVDLSGELLVLKSVDYSGNLQCVLVLRLNLARITESAKEFSRLGYDMALSCEGQFLIGEDGPMYQSLKGKGLLSAAVDFLRAGKYRIIKEYEESDGFVWYFGYDTSYDGNRALAAVWTAFLFIIAYGILLVILKAVTKRTSKPFLQLQLSNAEQTLQIREFLVLNLLRGTWKQDEIDNYMHKNGMTYSGGYRLMLIRLREENEEEVFFQKLPEEIRNESFIIPVQYHNYIVLLINAEEEILVGNRVTYLYNGLYSYAAGQNLHIMAGVSSYFTSLEGVTKAYSECREALMSRISEQEESSFIVLYDDLLLRSRRAAFVECREDSLYEAVRSCEPEAAFRALQAALQKIEDMKVWGMERSVFIYGLLLEILSVPRNEGLRLSDVFGEGQLFPQDLPEMLYDHEKLVNYILSDIIQPIIKALGKVRSSRSAEIVSKAVKLIRDCRGDITLTECAEKLNYHPSYLSRVIKAERNISFQDMVNEEKVRRAQTMLLTGRMSVAEISERLGYNNVQNFIRFFKNQVGMTPIQFRKERKADV